MIAFLLKASLTVAILWLFYRIFLEKESFFATNRIYLLCCILLMFILPFITLPELTEKQGFVGRTVDRMEIVKPIESPIGNIHSDYQAIETNPDTQQVAKEGKTSGYPIQNKRGALHWFLMIYYFGAGVLVLNLVTQFASVLIKVARSSDRITDSGYTIINTNLVKEPCSFFKYIFIDPKQFEYDTYEQILAHEKIHVRKLHTIDLLLSEIAVIVLWFNPIIWLFRKEVEKNLEFQTDNILVSQESVEKGGYQMNLLKIATYTKPLAITTNYNQSLIKQRILKMRTKKSNPHGYWKYAFLAPILFTLLLVMNKPSTIMAQSNGKESGIVIVKTEDGTTGKKMEEYPGDEVVKLQQNEISDPGCKALLKAILEQDISSVKELLKSTNPDCIDANPVREEIVIGSNKYYSTGARTPMVAAARTGNIEIGKLLVASNADIEFRAEHDESALMSASAHGNLDFVKYLLGLGAEPNRTIKGEGSAILVAARNGHLETVEYLHSQGASIDEEVSGEGTPLLAAAQNGRVEIVGYLLSNGADANREVIGEGTALLVAARNGHTKTVGYLISKGAEINSKVPGEGTALIASSQNGHMETIKYLLEQGADVNEAVPGEGSPLLVAARNGRLETVDYLVSNGADIDGKVQGEGTALIAASENGRLGVVKFLLSRGADINESVPGEGSPLLSAARNGQLETVKFLIENNAIVDVITPGEGTALICAVRSDRYDVAKLLLDNGADPYLNSPGDEYAMYHARISENKTMIELLSRYEKGN